MIVVMSILITGAILTVNGILGYFLTSDVASYSTNERIIQGVLGVGLIILGFIIASREI